MSLRRPALKSPGGPPLSEKRDLYIELVSKGLSNSAACRVVGVNRRTGTRWRRGQTVSGLALSRHRLLSRPRFDEGLANVAGIRRTYGSAKGRAVRT